MLDNIYIEINDLIEKGLSIKSYDQLSTDQKIQAIEKTIKAELLGIEKHINYKKEQIKTRLHKGVNNRNAFKRVKSAVKIKTKLWNPLWVELFMISNFSEFVIISGEVFKVSYVPLSYAPTYND